MALVGVEVGVKWRWGWRWGWRWLAWQITCARVDHMAMKMEKASGN